MKSKNFVVIMVLAAAISLNYRYASADCPGLEKQISNKIEKANYCSADEDCIVVDFGCPFGCGSYISRNEDIGPIKGQIESYVKLCGECEYRCLRPLAPVCVNSRCVATLCESDKEYDSFACECPENTRHFDYYNENKKKWVFKCVPKEEK